MKNMLAKFKMAAQLVSAKPVFLLLSTQGVLRNEPVYCVDVGNDMDTLLTRKGNESGKYVVMAFEIKEKLK